MIIGSADTYPSSTSNGLVVMGLQHPLPRGSSNTATTPLNYRNEEEEEEGRVDIESVHIAQERRASNKRHRKTVRRIAAVPWVFAVLGILITVAVLTVVVTLEYTAMVNVVDRVVRERAEVVLEGSVKYISTFNNKTATDTNTICSELALAGNSSSSPIELVTSMNDTLWRNLVWRVLGDPNDMGYFVSVMGPPIAPNDYPEQDLADQSQGCVGLCRRPGDPKFTEIAEFGILHDRVLAKDDEYRIITAENNVNSTFISMFLVNRSSSTAPSWAVDASSETVQLTKLIRGTPYRTGSSLALYQNGSAFDGVWNPVSVTSSPQGNSYYFQSHRMAFIHPLNNLTVIITNPVSVNQYQDVISAFASRLGGDNGHLLIVDKFGRVIGYNKDPYGDSRLASCSIKTIPGTVGRPCENFFAVDHPTPFVQRLFRSYGDFIMSASTDFHETWFTEDDTRYLLVRMPIQAIGGTRLVAAFALKEEDVVGSLKRDTLVTAIICGVLVGVACVFLTLVGFCTLYNSQRVVVLATKLAVCISTTDLETADTIIAEHFASQRCFTRQEPVVLQLMQIIDNLRMYRPFLPAALLLPGKQQQQRRRDSRRMLTTDGHNSSTTTYYNPNQTPRSSSSPSSSISIVAPFNRRRFRPFVGSFVLVDLGNLPIPTNISKRSAVEEAIIINKFLATCIDMVDGFGGVAEVVRSNQFLASFNCHSQILDHEDVACQCALRLRGALGEGSSWCKRKMNVAICVSSGIGLVGSAGSNTVKARVVSGEPIDLLRRLPSLQRKLGVSILITEETAQGLSEGVARIPVDVLAPTWWQPDRTTKLKVYELLGNRNQLLPDQIASAQARLTIFAHLYGHHNPRGASDVLKSLPDTLLGTYPFLRLSQLCFASAQKTVSSTSNSGSINSGGPTNPVVVVRLTRRETSWQEIEGAAYLQISKAKRALCMYPTDQHMYHFQQHQPHNPGKELHTFHQAQIARRAELYDFCQSAPDIINDDIQSLRSDSLETSMPLFGMYLRRGSMSATLVPSSPPSAALAVTSGLGRSGGDVLNDPRQQHLGTILIKSNDDEAGGHASVREDAFGDCSTLSHPVATPTPPPPPSTATSHHRQSQRETPISPSYQSGQGEPSSCTTTDSVSGLTRSDVLLAATIASRVVITSVSGDHYYPTNHLIGQGAFGRVILALHETGGLVAMKQIPLAALEGGVEPLIKEMELLSSLNHPNVSSYVTCAVSRHDNSFCIMMEYLASGSLYDLINVTSPIEGISSTLRTSLALKYARQVVNGLHYLHTRTPPILHLDVKPQNVLMTAEGSCKLIDFGTSKLVQDKCILRGSGAEGGQRLSTEYTAPEAVVLGEFSPASDIYSLGVTMLHMLLGHLPDTILDARSGHPQVMIPDWIDDPQLAALLEECTSPHPSQRPTAKAILDRIRTF